MYAHSIPPRQPSAPTAADKPRDEIGARTLFPYPTKKHERRVGDDSHTPPADTVAIHKNAKNEHPFNASDTKLTMSKGLRSLPFTQHAVTTPIAIITKVASHNSIVNCGIIQIQGRESAHRVPATMTAATAVLRAPPHFHARRPDLLSRRNQTTDKTTMPTQPTAKIPLYPVHI